MSDGRALLERAAELVAIRSVSGEEAELAGHVAAELTRAGHLEVTRVGDNVVARTLGGRPTRLVLAGHLDTVPPAGNDRPVVEGDRLEGLGAVDMKGGLAVLLACAEEVREPAVEVTYVLYAREEVDQRRSGLAEVASLRPDLLAADAAVLAEPTGGVVEAGCQGTLHATVRVRGVRAHTARPWRGRNALHRLGPVLDVLESYEGRRPVIDGCEYRESLQAVRAAAGVAGNVVPDEASVVVNHRFAPDRDAEAAFAALVSLLRPVLDEAAGDEVVLDAAAAPAPPSLGHPLLASLVAASGAPPRAKLGWTDVSFFAARGVPAANFGPGDPELAHRADERVSAGELEHAYGVLVRLLG